MLSALKRHVFRFKFSHLPRNVYFIKIYYNKKSTTKAYNGNKAIKTSECFKYVGAYVT